METKHCPDCGHDKPINDFAFRNKDRGTRQPYCDNHRKIRAKIYYQTHKAGVVKATTNRSKNNIKQFREWKDTLNCLVCGESHNSCLDFHHIDPTTKEIELGKIGSCFGHPKFISELEKVIVVCKNCHSKVHDGVIDLTNYNIKQAQYFLIESIKSRLMDAAL